MMNNQAEDRINEVICTIINCPQSEVLPDKHLYYDLLADSLMMTDLLLIIEQEFNVKINDDAVGDLNRVSDLYRLIDEKRSLM